MTFGPSPVLLVRAMLNHSRQKRTARPNGDRPSWLPAALDESAAANQPARRWRTAEQVPGLPDGSR